MPLTQPGRQALDQIALENGSRLREWSAANRAAWATKNPEQAKRDDEEKALWNAARDAAYAISPAHGELYDLMSLCMPTDKERFRHDELWRQVYPLMSGEEITDTADRNPSLAA